MKDQIQQQEDQIEDIMILCALQAGLMGHGVPVVADLSAGDAEMHRVIEETVKALGGLDIIVNRHTPTHALTLYISEQTAVHAQQRHT